MKNVFVVLSMVLLLASCNSSKKAKSSSELFLTGTRWTVIKVKDMMSTSKNPRVLELSLPDKKGNGSFTGNTGCNTMSGNYSSEKGTKKIQFTNAVTTKMACDDKQENTFVSAINTVNSYEISGKILKLYSGGDLLLTLEGVNIAQ